MIKINLIPQRRAKRSAASDPSSKHVAVGFAAIGVAAVAVFFLVDRPKRAKLAEIRESIQRLDGEISGKNGQLTGYAELKKEADAADDRFKAIRRLLNAKVVPAHVLHELGEIMTANRFPTMTEDMAKKTGGGLEGDSNKRFQQDWDATHVWLAGFSDTNGEFKLEGGAQAESDVTQLALRLQASVYFDDVAPAGVEHVSDGTTGTMYYKFTITGKVAY